MNWIKDYNHARKEYRTALADNDFAMDCLRNLLNGKRSREECRDDLRKRLEKSGGYFDKNGKLLEQEQGDD